jgi:hypothetical protein
MKAISVRQPWAYLIETGQKPVENRTWKPPASMLGELICIHASAGMDRDDRECYEDLCGDDEVQMLPVKDLTRGSIVAVTKLVGWWSRDFGHVCAPNHEEEFKRITTGKPFDKFYCGDYGWVFGRVVPVEPVPVKGALGLWTVPTWVHTKVLRDLVKHRLEKGPVLDGLHLLGAALLSALPAVRAAAAAAAEAERRMSEEAAKKWAAGPGRDPLKKS